MSDSAPRKVDSAASSYLKSVEAIMSQRYGLSYSEVYEDLHGSMSRLKADCAAGTAVAEFVGQVAAEAGFVAAGDGVSVANAREYNKRAAALICFARENSSWQIGEDGIYSDAKAGVVRVHPQFDAERSRWEFGFSVAEGDTLHGAGAGRPRQGAFRMEFVGSDFDIGDSLDLLARMKPEFAAGAEPSAGLNGMAP